MWIGLDLEITWIGYSLLCCLSARENQFLLPWPLSSWLVAIQPPPVAILDHLCYTQCSQYPPRGFLGVHSSCFDHSLQVQCKFLVAFSHGDCNIKIQLKAYKKWEWLGSLSGLHLTHTALSVAFLVWEGLNMKCYCLLLLFIKLISFLL